MWIQNIIDRIVVNNCYHTREHLWELWIAILLHSAFRSICLEEEIVSLFERNEQNYMGCNIKGSGRFALKNL
jgi:hypothetical protein